MFRILHNTKWDFLSQWKIAIVSVAVFVVPALFLVPISGFNYSIEFTGGTEVQLQFVQAPALADVRAAIADAGIEGAEVTTFGAPDEIRIRAQEREQLEQQEAGAESVVNDIERALRERFGAEAFTVGRTEGVGPRVGAELRQRAVLAVLLAFGVTLVYLAWRFEWRFGLAAVLATLHDTLATLALIKYLDLEVSLFVVAGILTVVGYSMNDTVVVFDRVRENLKLHRKMKFYDLLNCSVNETLPRTVMTGMSTLASLFALLIFGGAMIQPFAIVLIFGIIVGTFSSIWIASPLLLWIEKKYPRASDVTPHARAAAARP